MKKIFTLCLSFSLCSGIAHAQTMIYSQNFNSTTTTTPSEWTLNSTTTIAGISGTNNAPTGNEWLINNKYTGITATTHEPAGITGSPTSYYLHMNCGTDYSIIYGLDDNYLAEGSGNVYIAAMTTPLVTTGFTNVYFSFWWLCLGDATGDEGNLYYSTDGGTSWTQITTAGNFYGSTTWTDDSFHVAAFDNQASLEFAFTFTDADAGATDPEFGIDDISLYGTPSVTATPPVASFTSPDTAYCQNSCELFTSTTTGTVTGFSWVAPGAIVESPTSDTTTICFLAAGAYSVTLTATNTGGANSFTSVINVTPAPSPVITQSGNVLSVASDYSSYQWYIGTGTPITGATTDSYTISASGLYGVAVDSAGCTGYDTLTAMYTTGIANVSNIATNYWIVQSDNGTLNLNASISLSSPLAITIFDATGRKILNDTWNAGSLTKQINGIYTPSGMYIIKLNNDYTSTILKWLKP